MMLRSVNCTKEGKIKYFSFADIEDVIPGDRIPFLVGTSKRLK